MNHPLNQQENCECKVPVECHCGHTPVTHCAKCRKPMSAETPPTSPHPVKKEQRECKKPNICKLYGANAENWCWNCNKPLRAISPRPDGWEERFDEKFTYLDENGDRYLLGSFDKDKNISTDNIPDIKSFILQELTTLHKADCERFKHLVGGMFPVAGALSKQREKDRVNTLNQILTALSKMEEENYWKEIYEQEKLNLEHDQELIKEGHQRSDRDTRRGI